MRGRTYHWHAAVGLAVRKGLATKTGAGLSQRRRYTHGRRILLSSLQGAAVAAHGRIQQARKRLHALVARVTPGTTARPETTRLTDNSRTKPLSAWHASASRASAQAAIATAIVCSTAQRSSQFCGGFRRPRPAASCCAAPCRRRARRRACDRDRSTAGLQTPHARLFWRQLPETPASPAATRQWQPTPRLGPFPPSQ